MVSGLRSLFLATFVFLTAAVPATAQQSVLLQIRPHVGDTLRVRLDQEVAMTGMPAACGMQSSALRARSKGSPNNCGDVRAMTTRMEVYTRAIVQRASRDATDLLAITDSVMTSPGAGKARLHQPVPRGPAEIRITTDGSVEVGAGQASDEVREMFGQMPAT